MDWMLLGLICFVLVIVSFIELSYFSYNGRKVSFISKLILALIFPIILIVGFVLGSIFLLIFLGVVVVLVIVALIVYLFFKIFRKKKENVIIIKRKK